MCCEIISYYKLPRLSINITVSIVWLLAFSTTGEYMKLKHNCQKEQENILLYFLIDLGIGIYLLYWLKNRHFQWINQNPHDELVWDVVKMLRDITSCVWPAMMQSKLCLSPTSPLPGHLLSQTCQRVDISLDSTPDPSALMSHYPFLDIFSEYAMSSYCQWNIKWLSWKLNKQEIKW